MVEFKDLAGLSEPLTRLIDVVAEGVGGVTKATLTRRNADAKALEIRTISDAIKDSQQTLGPITYDDGKILIESSGSGDERHLPEAALENRMIARTKYLEEKRQLNVESIVRHAADELVEKEEICSERPDSDWISRFFRIAEDITTEHMQVLWGRVLAGEVRQVGTFSLRALDLLKNINQGEAEVFAKIGKLAVIEHDAGKAFLVDDEAYLASQYEVSFLDILLLKEIGLLFTDSIGLKLHSADNEVGEIVLTCGSSVIKAVIEKGAPLFNLAIIPFTDVGFQLLQLLDKKERDSRYLRYVCSKLKRPQIKLYSGKVRLVQGTVADSEDMKEVIFKDI